MSIEFKPLQILFQILLLLYQSARHYLLDNPAIAGVLLGFLLTQGTIYIREQALNRKRAKLIRRILELEIHYNLKLISHLGDDIKLAQKSNIWIEPQSFSLPVWNRIAFESHLSELSSVLNEEDIINVFEFYGSLEALVIAHKKVSFLEAARIQAIKKGNIANIDNELSSIVEAGELYEEAESLSKESLKEWSKFKELTQRIQSSSPL